VQRLVLLAMVASVLQACGCANRQTLLQPADNPDEVIATIAKRGQGAEPTEITRDTGSDAWPKAVKTTACVSWGLLNAALYFAAEVIDGTCDSIWPPRKGNDQRPRVVSDFSD
jgi:hypothetical protein